MLQHWQSIYFQVGNLWHKRYLLLRLTLLQPHVPVSLYALDACEQRLLYEASLQLSAVLMPLPRAPFAAAGCLVPSPHAVLCCCCYHFCAIASSFISAAAAAAAIVWQSFLKADKPAPQQITRQQFIDTVRENAARMYWSSKVCAQIIVLLHENWDADAVSVRNMVRQSIRIGHQTLGFP